MKRHLFSKAISKKLSSSVGNAVFEAEKYLGTEVEKDNVVPCQDVITEKDRERLSKIAEDNNTYAKIGRYSVTFVDAEKYLDEFTNVLE